MARRRAGAGARQGGRPVLRRGPRGRPGARRVGRRRRALPLPGEEHLFADSSLRGYDAAAAKLLTERVLAFLEEGGVVGGDVHDQGAGRVDVGRVRRAGRAQQRRLRRVLVHRLSPRRSRQGDDGGAEPAAQAEARQGGEGPRGARVRRRRLPRLVPVRRARRGAADQEPRRVRKGPDDLPGLADRVQLRRQGAPPPGRGDRRAGRCARPDRAAWAAAPSRDIRRPPAPCPPASSSTVHCRPTSGSASRATARSASTAGS